MKHLPYLNTIGIILILVVVAAILAILVTNRMGLDAKDFIQYIDHDLNVVCYVLKSGQGLSCLPLR